MTKAINRLGINIMPIVHLRKPRCEASLGP
jgi:hypothetical protein